MKDAKSILSEVLSERQAANQAYSLRAFARDLGISPQQLSNVMSGRRGLGPKLAKQVVDQLDLSASQSELFLESLRAEFSRSQVQRVVSKSKLASLKASESTRNLELDTFKIVSNWYHFTLVELIKLSKNKTRKTEWFSAKLGIPENEVKLALGRLERVGLISRNGNRLSANQDVMIADGGITTESIKNYHRQFLEKASQALAFQTSEERYGSSSSIPIKVKDIALAKKLIQKFRLEFDEALSDTDQGEEVYGLSLQFFRLTNPTQTKPTGENEHE